MAVEVWANDGTASVISGGTGAPAAGTVESWTLSGSTLPAVSSTATTPTCCYLADVLSTAKTEKILVTNISGATATVTRGADGTTPVTHATGFTVENVITRASLAALQSDPEFNIADWGAVPDAYTGLNTYTYNSAATNNTTAIQNAINAAAAGGGTVVVPAGAFMTDQLTLPDSVNLRGISRKLSTLVLKSGTTNGNLIVSAGFGTGDAATSTDDSWAGTSYLNISDLSFDGNQVNQSTHSGQSDYRNQFAVIKLYTWHMEFHDVEIRNALENGLYTEHAANWDTTFNEYQFGESVYENLFVKNFGGAGWCNRGPHDSRGASVYLSSYNAGGTDAYAGYVQQGNGNYGSSGMILHNLHAWGQFSTNAVYVSGSNILDGFIYAEGSTQSAIYLYDVAGARFTATTGYCPAGVELAGSSSDCDIACSPQYGNVSAGLFQLDGDITGCTLSHVPGGGTIGTAMFDLATGSYTGSGNTFRTDHPDQATVMTGTKNVTDRTLSTPMQGTLTLNGTTAVVVSDSAVTANSRIFLTIQAGAGTAGSPYVSARTAGTSFSVKSTAAGDTSTCAYLITEP
jgi:hypothetical protein